MPNGGKTLARYGEPTLGGKFGASAATGSCDKKSPGFACWRARDGAAARNQFFNVVRFYMRAVSARTPGRFVGVSS